MFIKNLYSAACMIIFLLALLAGAARADDVTYGGDSAELKAAMGFTRSVFAGPDGSPLASGNDVTVNYTVDPNQENIPSQVFGGLSDSAVVRDNTATLEQGEVDGNFYGGHGAEAGAVNNTINIKGGDISDSAYAGWSNGGNAIGNRAFMYSFGGNELSSLAGGYAAGGGGGAIGNSVVWTGGNPGAQVYGGSANTGAAEWNSVLIDLGGGTVTGDFTIYGGSTGGRAASNDVILDSGTVNGHLIGGYSGTAENNRVVINGGAVLGTQSDRRRVHGGSNYDRGDRNRAANNTVIIKGTPKLEYVDVYGGFNQLNGTAENNSVILSGQPDLKTASLYGRDNYAGGGGNVLNIVNHTGTITVQTFHNFQKIQFCLPKPLTLSPVIKTTESITLENVNIDITGIVSSDNTVVSPGTTVTLIKAVSITASNVTVGGNTALNLGAEVANVSPSGGGTWTFTLTSTALTATLTDAANIKYIRAVDDISGVPTEVVVGTASTSTPSLPISLPNAAAVTPDTATEQTITWDIVNPGTAGAGVDVNNGTLNAAADGSIMVRATVAGGIAPGWDYTQDFTITVKALSITTDGQLPDGTVEAAYSKKLEAVPAADVAWAIAPDSSLPAGLNLSTAGVISGTPETAGTFTFTVTGTSPAGSKSKLFTIKIAEAQSTSPANPPAATSPENPTNPPAITSPAVTTNPTVPATTSPAATTSPTIPATTSPATMGPIFPALPAIPPATTSPTEPTGATTAPTSPTSPSAPAYPAPIVRFPSDMDEVAARTGISSDDLEERGGMVYLGEERAKEIVNGLSGAWDTESLPVFAVTFPSESQYGGNAEVKLNVKGADMLALFTDEIKLIGMTSPNTGRQLINVYDRISLTDGRFLVLHDGAIYKGEIDPDADYEVIVVIRDDGPLDLDKTPGEVMASLFFAAERNIKRGGGGCGAVTANSGMLMLALALSVPFIRGRPRRKRIL